MLFLGTHQSLAPMLRLRSEVDRLFNRLFEEFPAFRPTSWPGARSFPPLNMWEDGGHLYLRAELPGVPPDELELAVAGEELTVAGKRDDPTAGETRGVLRRERVVGSFRRHVHLPVAVKAEGVRAEMHDGILTVMLPKREAARTRQVRVKAKTT